MAAPLDAKLYREALEYYRQWNEAELRERARNAGKLSPQEAWRRHVGLIEFGWQLSPRQSQWQRRQKLEHLAEYYRVVQKLEEWRQARERSPQRPSAGSN